MPRARWVLAVVASLMMAGCTLTDEPEQGELPGPGDSGAGVGADGAYGPDDEITALATGLDTVWEIAFAPDGRLFATERPGRVVTIDPGTGEVATWARVDVEEVSESGLMGLALDPAFADNGRVYLCYTVENASGQLENRVVRWVEGSDGAGHADQVLVDGIAGSQFHDGCRLGFGSEGLLYVTMGDAAASPRAQDPFSRNGKVLRLTPEGDPRGALDTGDPYVYTLGHRNPQGLAFHPDTGTPYVSEHGPENHDEVNVLVAGENYGWPVVRGRDDGGGSFEPAIWSSGGGGTVAPAGAAFIDAEGSPLDGAFVFGTLKAAQIHVLSLGGEDHDEVTDEQVILDGDFGRLRAVVWGPDEALYVSTSNKDGRGSPGPQDDRVIRVPLAALEEAVEAASG